MKRDENSNHAQIDPSFEKGVWVWVKVPKRVTPPTSTTGGGGGGGNVPPTYPNTPTGTVPPVQSVTSEGAPCDNYDPGVSTGTCWVDDVPESVDPGKSLDICANYKVPPQAVAFPLTLELHYAVTAKGAALPSAMTVISATIAAAFAHDMLGRTVFNIPASAFAGKAGGKTHFALYRRGDSDSNPNTLEMLSTGVHWGDPITVA
jgi:hypothetical protein